MAADLKAGSIADANLAARDLVEMLPQLVCVVAGDFRRGFLEVLGEHRVVLDAIQSLVEREYRDRVEAR